jgi:hypothetical protein
LKGKYIYLSLEEAVHDRIFHSENSYFMFVHINATTVMTPEAEKFNGWAAMLGFVAAFGAYATTGQIIPGIF